LTRRGSALRKKRGCQAGGANCFGIAAPIVTGYVVAETGSYNSAFFITGTLLVLGALCILTMTRRPIDEVSVRDEYSSAPSLESGR